jgi:high affinity Mn2+ porin
VDVFDTNAYAHDPRGDFLNWAVVDAGAFDYAADPWGYTYGAAVEGSRAAWTLRAGIFQMSSVPNGKLGGLGFGQHMVVGELERRHEWNGHAGKLKLTVFSDEARMGSYRDAVALAAQGGSVPDVSLVRRKRSKAGAVLNLEQELTADVGAFVRASASDGDKETYDFTDIHRSLATGVAIKGSRWQRAKDTVGFAAALNALARPERDYLAGGGTGLLIGDGRLDYGPEKIAEAYYAAQVSPRVTVTFDYQRIVHPAYNRDRGPVSLFALRVHSEF